MQCYTYDIILALLGITLAFWLSTLLVEIENILSLAALPSLPIWKEMPQQTLLKMR